MVYKLGKVYIQGVSIKKSVVTVSKSIGKALVGNNYIPLNINTLGVSKPSRLLFILNSIRRSYSKALKFMQGGG